MAFDFRGFVVDWNEIHEGNLRALKRKINFRSRELDSIHPKLKFSIFWGKKQKKLNFRWYLITFFNDSCLIKDAEDSLVFAVTLCCW